MLQDDYEQSEPWRDESEGPQQVDLDWPDDGADDWVTCPSCKEDVSEMAAKCPCCGYWIAGSDGAEQRSLGWFWPTMVGMLVALILGIWIGR